MWDLIVSFPDHCLSFYFDNIFGNDLFLMNTVLPTFLIVCIQTGSVGNGWKFAIAKRTELAL